MVKVMDLLEMAVAPAGLPPEQVPAVGCAYQQVVDRGYPSTLRALGPEQ
jgi:hypothetical protein